MISRLTPRQASVVGLILVLLLFSTLARAEEQNSVKFIGESPVAKLRLTQARKHLDEHKWSEAIEELQTILNTVSSDLVAIAPVHSVQAGQICRIQLASLPADGLRLYRQRYESQAGKKLQQAQSERDVPQLRKLVEDAFCTRAAEHAMDLLGDLAFERGCFDEAEEWWRLLSPLPDAQRDNVTRGFALVYPDPSIDPARVQAKQLLARLFQDPATRASGSPSAQSDWRIALESYRQRHAKAEGELAGRKGRYADVLQELAARRNDDANREDWLTFAGDPSRGRPIPASEDILDRLSELCRDGPTWSFNLERLPREQETTLAPAVNAAQARSLAFHPVIVGHQVLVADARYVTAFDLRNGQSAKWYDVGRFNENGNPNLRLPAPLDLRYTLTVAGNQAYVRLGAQNIGVEELVPQHRFVPALPRLNNETFLACLSLRPDNEGGHFRWGVRGIAHDNSLFEGAPLASGGLIWIASTRYQGSDCLTSIECYNASDAAEPPLRWRCDLCKTSQTKAGEPRYRHHLLTLAGTQIVYCSHTGSVVAVDALTGRKNWAIRYPKRTIEAEEVDLRDLTPVLFAASRLYVAPADSNTLLCLDPATGRTLWELEPRQVVHLLGVGQGRLILTTPKGLQAVQADNGNPVWAVPDTGGGLTPSGRGLLIGDLVLFPTTQPRDLGSPSLESVVYVLRQSDGRPADDPANLHRLPAGNLAYGNGCLAVADQRTLSVFVPPRLLLRKRQAQAQIHPDSPTALLELARAEVDDGRSADALRTFRRAESKTQDLPASRRKQIIGRLRTEQQALLLEMARRAAGAKRWDEAESAIQQALAVLLPPRGRLHALLRAAQIWLDAGETGRCDSLWEAILSDEQLRQIQVINKNGNPMSAADSAADHLGVPSVAATRRGAGKSAPLRVAAKLPLFRTWHARLGSDEWILEGWRDCNPEWLLTGSAEGRFICRLASTGAIRWQVRLPFAPRWAGCHADTLLAAGEEGVSCLRRDDGQLIWHFPVPAAGRSPGAHRAEVRVVLDPQSPEPLTAFQLVGGRMYCLQGQRRLFSLNAVTGAILWHRWSPDAELHLPFPRGCFSSCYHVGTETVLIQASGRRWVLDAANGRQLHHAPDGADLWLHPALELDERTWCVVSDNQHVVLLNAVTGRCLWQNELEAGTTLSGELPSVLGRGDLLLYVQPANLGYYLHRLDCVTGKSVWPRPQLLTARTVDVRSWAFDTDAMYSIEDRLLIARSLTDGAVLWRRPLPTYVSLLQPGDAWQAQRVGDYLAVSPQASVDARLRFRTPLGPLQWDLASLAVPEASFPLSCYDPKTGQLIQRLNLRIESPLRTTLAKQTTREEGGRTWIVRTASLLASADGAVIRLDVPHPIVAVGREIWGLTAIKSDFTAENAENAEKKQ